MEINFKHTTINEKTTHNIFRNYECKGLKKNKKIKQMEMKLYGNRY